MKKIYLTLSILGLLAVSLAFTSNEAKMIRLYPSNDKICYYGAFFISVEDSIAHLNRFDRKTLNNSETFMNKKKANTQSGISIAITTNSPEVVFHFSKRKDAQNRFGLFSIYKDGNFYKYISINKEEENKQLELHNKENKMTEWRVYMPIFSGVDFRGIDIVEGSKYEAAKPAAPKVYAAIGNSITHGTGQKASNQTYSFLLAQAKSWQYYNLGVGGSKISWPVAKMLKNQKVDVFTILWGFNDWNAGYTIENEIAPRYKKLVETLAKDHPKAKIYCITPTATKRTQPKRGDLSIEDIRRAEADIVKSLQEKGYKNIYLIHGPEISDTSMLNDVVHFNIEGAAKFAKELENKVSL